MKTKLFLIIACLMTVLASCGPTPQDKLKKACYETNRDYPQDFGNGIVLQSVTYTDGDVVYHATCDEDYFPLYDAEVRAELAKQMRTYVYSLLDEDPSTKAMVDLCREAGADIVYEYSTVQGNTYDIRIPL